MKVSLFVIFLASFGITEKSTFSDTCFKAESNQCNKNLINNPVSNFKSPQKIRDGENLNPDSENHKSQPEVPTVEVSTRKTLETAGILNLFENATHWAVMEEKIFQLTKLLYQKIKAETLVLHEFIQDYESTTRKHLLCEKLGSQTEKEKAQITASSTIGAYRMTYRYIHLLQKLKNIMALNFIDTDLQESLGVKCLPNSGEDCIKYSSRVAGSLLREWPNRIDLALAMHSLIHIQEVYNYNYTQLPDVLSPETTKPPKLNAFHSAEIGQHALYKKHFAVGIEWMEHAVNLFKYEFDSSIPLHVLEYYLEIAAKMHNQQRILQRTLRNKIVENLLLRDVIPFQQSSKNNERISNVVLKLHGGSGKPGFQNAYFNGICSGNKFQGLQEFSALYCWYDKSSSPARAIQPYKKEFLSFKPEVVQVYDVLGDNLISSLTVDRTDCGIPNEFDKKHLAQTMRTRTPTTCYLQHLELESFLNKISSLTLTDLRTKGSRQVSSVDYLPGRVHVVHRDAYQLLPDHPAVQKQLQEDGDRIYSVVAYINDVQAGGWTPFPGAGIAASPIKGSAVIWKNLFRNGSAMEDTWHGSCPVIYGHKQVAVVFIYSKSQFLTHPCSLNQYE